MHEVRGPRSRYRMMSRTTKSWIKGTRVFQLGLRVLEVIGAVGLLVLMILINNVEELTGWVLRITVRLTSHPFSPIPYRPGQDRRVANVLLSSA